ncbi:MAG: hypothetical protein DWG80_05945, partial [Chloroflexi bacterium]|nr:hypothetical protein [Chloroflexota bacterium]
MARATEASGPTVDEAVDRALAELGLRRDQVDVDVVTEGKKGGLFGRGAEPAVVRVTAIEAPPASGGARVSRETSDGDDDESRPRRRRGRRGGRRRRGGGGEGGDAEGGEAVAAGG